MCTAPLIKLSAVFLSALSCTWSTAVADEIHVPPGESIQEAINSSGAQDWIVLSAGTYSGFYVVDRGVRIRGVEDNDGDGIPETIIDGNQSTRVVLVWGDAALPPGVTQLTLNNVVIQNGLDAHGAGLSAKRAAVNLNNCVFLDNQAHQRAGAIEFSEYSSGELVNCQFLNNSAVNESSYGGAVVTRFNSLPSFQNCSFVGNTAPVGGALYAEYSLADLSDCSFTDNTATHTHGGAIYVGAGDAFYGELSVMNCSFINNSSLQSGGAIDTDASSGTTVSIQNSTLCSNTPDQIDGPYVDNDGNCITEFCDSDDDGTLDCNDGCPNDPAKTEPGICGCGSPDTDTDGDGTLDCNDPCPNWPYDCSEDEQILYVPVGEINNAIKIAASGSVLSLYAETYTLNESVDPIGKAITLKGVADADGDGMPETIVHGGWLPTHLSTLVCQNGETSDTIFDSLLVTGGTRPQGAGMNIQNSSPSIVNCVFRDNFADTESGTPALGGGIYMINSSPTLTNCIFRENGSEWNGGAIYCGGNSSPTIEGCTFGSNYTDNFGGGIYIDNSSPTIANCEFNGNYAAQIGGGIFTFGSSPSLNACSITSNIAVNGAGMYNWNSSPDLIGCSIVQNQASVQGGGIFNFSSNLSLTNSNVCGNQNGQVEGSTWTGENNCIDTTCTTCECEADLDESRLIDRDDLIMILKSWSDPYTIHDLLLVLRSWGPCY